jgi:K+-transporting ATPase A subunit
VTTAYWSESHGNPAFAAFDVNSTPSAFQAGGNMEGKEVRFGITPSALFATVTTDAGGAVDAMHDSFLPLGGMVLIVNMALGEVTFGGVGSGLYGMLAFAIVTMFVAGLMVGRTPEYLGKKLEAREVKMTMLALLSYSLSIWAGRRLQPWYRKGWRVLPTPARTGSPRSCTPSRPPPATTAARLPVSPPTRCSTTSFSPRRWRWDGSSM